jgi:hypothetical protein
MIALTSAASPQRPLTRWHTLTVEPDRPWPIASLNACFGVLALCAWVRFNERRWLPRAGSLVAIALRRNMATAADALRQLIGRRPEQDAFHILSIRNA